MSENLIINNVNKVESYQTLLPQIESLIAGESNLVANLANIAAAIKMTFNHLWVGFYLVEIDTLILGPFQGPIACTRIKKGKGVCGASWEKKETIVVKNVNDFPGHIACSSESVSEIVVPLFNEQNEVFGVLDIDSTEEGKFDETDQHFLEKIVQLISN